MARPTRSTGAALAAAVLAAALTAGCGQPAPPPPAARDAAAVTPPPTPAPAALTAPDTTPAPAALTAPDTTPVPAAAATPPPAPPAPRSELAVGSYRPSETTTGVPAGTVLKPLNPGGAELVITQDGTVLDGVEIYGDVKVRARNVTIRNSRLHGGPGIPVSNTGIIDATGAGVVNLVIEDNTIIPDRPSYYRDGIVGHDYTARRNHIQGTNDGLGIFNRPGGPPGANVTAEGNYIHSLTFWSNDPAHTDGTHNDGIQVQGGENIRIAGNTIVASARPGRGSGPNPRGGHAGIGIMLQQNVARLGNVVVERNWVDDGQTSINIDHGKYATITVTVAANYLGRNQFDFGNGSKYPVRVIKRAASSVPGLATNRWADSLTPLAEGAAGGIRFNG